MKAMVKVSIADGPDRDVRERLAREIVNRYPTVEPTTEAEAEAQVRAMIAELREHGFDFDGADLIH